LDEVKESVRQGVTKVASKLSSLANDFASSIQVILIIFSEEGRAFYIIIPLSGSLWLLKRRWIAGHSIGKHFHVIHRLVAFLFTKCFVFWKEVNLKWACIFYYYYLSE